MDDKLRSWVERTLDARVVGESRGFVGGSRELWYVDVEEPTGTASLVLRVETGTGVFADTDMSLSREAVVYRALRDTPVPVPELLATTADGSAMLLERVPGTSRTRGLPAAEAESVLEDLMQVIATLHTLDLDGLDLPGFARPAGAEDHALLDLRRWRALADERLPSLDPMLGYAFEWLGANAPMSVPRTALVQGDTGPGNFLADQGLVTGLVDWEFGHLGDPMDDLAWIDMRLAGSGLPTDSARRDAHYVAAGGASIDEASLRYYAVFVQLRCAVTTAMTLARGGGALGYIAYRAPNHRFLVQLGQSMATAMGIEVEPIGTVAGDRSVDTSVHDHALEGLTAEVVPALSNRAAKLRARAAVLTLEHLRTRDRFAGELRRQDADDRRATLGGEIDNAALTTRAAFAGSAGDPAMLGLLFRRAQRELVVWATPTVGESLAPLPIARDF